MEFRQWKISANMKSVYRALVLVVLASIAVAEDVPADSPSSLWEVIGDKITGLKEGIVSPHVVGGQEAKPHSFPHQVRLQITPKPGWGTYCGGSLISPEWVLTAAHCINNVHSVDVILGAHNGKTNNENTRQVIHVTKIIPEETYGTSDKDIALLKLERPAVLNQYVQTIRVPRVSQRKENLTGKPVTIVGWGIYTENPRADAAGLRFADTTVLSREECSKHFNPAKITEWRICSSGAGHKGACNGDSGGPLVLTEADGKRTVVGIASFVRVPCSAGLGSVFTRVDHFAEWIAKHTGIPIRP